MIRDIKNNLRRHDMKYEILLLTMTTILYFRSEHFLGFWSFEIDTITKTVFCGQLEHFWVIVGF